MKLLLVSHSPLITGGAEKSLVEYVEFLVKAGHTCRVIVPSRGEMSSILTDKGILWSVCEYIWATKPKHNQLSYIVKSAGKSMTSIFSVVTEFEPDIIITNTVVVPWGVYIGKALGIPTVLLVHETLSNNQVALAMEPNYETYISQLNDSVDYVIYNSEYTKSEYSKLFTKPIIGSELLYPVPNIEQYIDELYEPNHIGNEAKMVILGSMHERKRQLEALKAAATLKARGITGFKIDLYGDGDAGYIVKLKKYIKKNNLENDVTVKGYSSKVYDVLSRYNVVLCPFLYESFGRAALEGQLFGKVTITNDTGAGTELVKDGSNGLVYRSGDIEQFADKIEWVIKNKREAEKLGRTARTEQRKKYLSKNRYVALERMVDYCRDNVVSNHAVNRFDPIYSLSVYASDLDRKYRHLYKLTHNKVTRTALHHVRIVVRKVRARI